MGTTYHIRSRVDDDKKGKARHSMAWALGLRLGGDGGRCAVQVLYKYKNGGARKAVVRLAR